MKDNEARELLQAYKSRLMQRWNTAVQEHLKSLVPSLSGLILRQLDEHRPQMMKPVHAVFPEGTRYFWQESREAMIVFEEKPKLRTVRFETNGERKHDASRARLSFPYIIYLGSFDLQDHWWHCRSLQIYYRSKPLENLDDHVYYSNLPNINQDAEACKTGFAHATDKVGDWMLRWVRYFWESLFTRAWDTNFNYYGQNIDKRLASVSTWEKATNEDPMFILKVDWLRSAKLQDALGKAWGHLPSANPLYNGLRVYFDQATRDTWAEIHNLRAPETAKLDVDFLEAFNSKRSKK
jgi:hypothetical protein